MRTTSKPSGPRFLTVSVQLHCNKPFWGVNCRPTQCVGNLHSEVCFIITMKIPHILLPVIVGIIHITNRMEPQAMGDEYFIRYFLQQYISIIYLIKSWIIKPIIKTYIYFMLYFAIAVALFFSQIKIFRFRLVWFSLEAEALLSQPNPMGTGYFRKLS